MSTLDASKVLAVIGQGALKRTGSLVWYPGAPSVGEEGAETFTRTDTAGTGYFIDRGGTLRRAGANVPRIEWLDTDDDGANETPSTLLELSRANLLLRSEEFDNASWASVGTPVVTANDATAPDGTTTADKIEDNDAAGHEYREQVVTVANDSVTRVASVFVKKRTGAPIACVGLAYKGGTTVYTNLHLNPDTGAVAVESGSATPADYGVEDVGDYWRPWISLANNSSGNTSCTVVAIPARASTLGGSASSSVTGYNHFWGAMLSEGQAATSYIKTTTAAVTRAVETLSFPLPPAITAPSAAWARYTRWRAGIATSGGRTDPRIWQIGSGATSNSILALYWGSATTLRLIHANGSTSDDAVLTVSTAIGDTVEALALWSGDGEGTLVVSVNGAAVSSATLDGIAPASAWTTSATTYLNARDSGNNAGAMKLRDDVLHRTVPSGTNAAIMEAFRNLPLLAA